MNSAETFRARSSYFFAGVGLFLCLIALWSGISIGGARNLVTTFFWVAAAVTFLYMTFIKPKIVISAEGMLVINPVLRAQVGWADVIDLGAKWNLYIRTEERTLNVWAAPAPGRRHSRKLHASEVRGMKSASFELIAPAVSPRSESGVALHLAELEWAAFQKRDAGATATNLTSEFVNDWRGVICLSALLLLAIGLSAF